jgi:osmotically-inducible protein OsmY
MERSRANDEPPQYVAERIRGALAGDPRVGELDVHVRIAGQKVFLGGYVGTEERRRAITEIVQSLMPDHRVFNETNVHTATESSDRESLG